MALTLHDFPECDRGLFEPTSSSIVVLTSVIGRRLETSVMRSSHKQKSQGLKSREFGGH